MADCRNVIEFCRSFDPSYRVKKLRSLDQFCEHSPFAAAIDISVLFLALVALGILTFPYFKFVVQEATDLLPLTVDLIGDLIYDAPFAYAAGLVASFVSAVAVWEMFECKSRKCGRSSCKGLRKAVEFDIQLETEECVRSLSEEDITGVVSSVGVGQGTHKELEAELKKMAPVNGRTVLVFRAPCGCPVGRMEVWGQKKVRKTKK